MNQSSALDDDRTVSGGSALLVVLSAINAGVSRKRVYAALDAMWDVFEGKAMTMGEEILELLADGPRTSAELVPLIDARRGRLVGNGTLWHALNRLHKQGKVTRERAGGTNKWMYAPSGDDVAS